MLKRIMSKDNKSIKITEHFPTQTPLVHGNRCLGCREHNKDIMISFSDPNRDIHDLFLTQEQAVVLISRLTTQVKFNEESV